MTGPFIETVDGQLNAAFIVRTAYDQTQKKFRVYYRDYVDDALSMTWADDPDLQLNELSAATTLPAAPGWRGVGVYDDSTLETPLTYSIPVVGWRCFRDYAEPVYPSLISDLEEIILLAPDGSIVSDMFCSLEDFIKVTIK